MAHGIDFSASDATSRHPTLKMLVFCGRESHLADHGVVMKLANIVSSNLTSCRCESDLPHQFMKVKIIRQNGLIQFKYQGYTYRLADERDLIPVLKFLGLVA